MMILTIFYLYIVISKKFLSHQILKSSHHMDFLQTIGRRAFSYTKIKEIFIPPKVSKSEIPITSNLRTI